MTKIFVSILLMSFLTSTTLMPFYNFQDAKSTTILYYQFLSQDADGNLFEFITNKVLNLEDLFEDEDEQESKIPETQKHLPLQTIQIVSGSIYCTKPVLIEEKNNTISPRVFCSFIDNNYSLHFSSFIFHPPSFSV